MEPDVVSDSRFAAIHHDPRFARRHQKETKVKVDKRFAAVLTDSRFSDMPGSKRARTSSGGGSKPGAGAPASDTLNAKLYVLDDAAAEVEEEGAAAPTSVGGNKKSGKRARREPEVQPESASESEAETEAEDASDADMNGASNSDSDSDSGDDVGDTVESRLDRLNRMARGEIAGESESEDEDSDDDISISSELAAELEGMDEEARFNRLEELRADKKAERLAAELNAETEVVIDPEAPDLKPEYVPDGSETKRLALVNCDWDNLRAVDIFAALQSFAPPGGSIVDVSVYPSEYGMKRMAEEARFGPTPLYSSAAAAAASSSAAATTTTAAAAAGAASSGPASAPAPGAPRSSKAAAPAGGKHTVGAARHDNHRVESEFDPIRLRAYELNKMKYFFAIITCDSVATATAIYSQCDGMEFEASSNVMDLRFVPDDTEVKQAARDCTNSLPKDYEPADFVTPALQSSRVELTWDAEDPQRKRALDWDKIKARLAAKNADKRQKKRGRGRGRAAGSDAEDDEDDELGDVAAYLASSSGSDDSDDDADAEGLEEGNSDADMSKAAAAAARLDASSRGSNRAARKEEERARLRALLLGEKPVSGFDSDEEADGGSGSRAKRSQRAKVKAGKAPSSEDEEGAMEITFTPGLGDDILKKKSERETRETETPWEAYQRKRREKKKAKREASKEAKEAALEAGTTAKGSKKAAAAAARVVAEHVETSGDEGAGDLSADAFFMTASGEGSSGKKKSSDRAAKAAASADAATAAAKQRAQLELLTLGDAGADSGEEGEHGGRNYDLKAMMKAQKEADRAARKDARKKKKGDRALAAAEEKADSGNGGVSGDGFKLNLADNRFAAVTSNPEFSIDPTASQFRDTSGMRDLLKKRLEKRREEDAASKLEGNAAKARPMVVTSAGAAVQRIAADGSVVRTAAHGESVSDEPQTSAVDVKALAASVKSKFSSVPSTAGKAAAEGAGKKASRKK